MGIKLEKITVMITRNIMNSDAHVIYAHERPVYELIFGKENVVEDNSIKMPVPVGFVKDEKGKQIFITDLDAEHRRMKRMLPTIKGSRQHPVDTVFQIPERMESYMKKREAGELDREEEEMEQESPNNLPDNNPAGGGQPLTEVQRMKATLTERNIEFAGNASAEVLRGLLVRSNCDIKGLEYDEDSTTEELMELLSESQGGQE